jgi:UDPglucose 6-dehydrogenase
VRQALGKLRRKRIAVLGPSLRPNKDDTRDAVSIPIIKSMLAEGAAVAFHDPMATENAMMP